MQNPTNLQEHVLAELCQNKRAVTLFLMNGFQMKGVITGFDAFVVTVLTDSKQQMIYKHAISTIIPERPVSLDGESAGG